MNIPSGRVGVLLGVCLGLGPGVGQGLRAQEAAPSAVEKPSSVPPVASSATPPAAPPRPTPAPLTPAEQRIAAAKKAIEKDPKDPQGHTALALSLARRARETSDTDYYDQAEEALATALRLKPGNFEAEKVRVWVLLGRHELGQAAEAAAALNKKVPDDVLVYGFLADANIELGNYEEAEKAAQFMLDLRPGNIPGLTRGAYLRELFGDVDGAIEFMKDAYERLPYAEVEDRAWVLTQVSHLELSRGKIEPAEHLAAQSLELFPDYHYALSQMAKVRSAQGRHADAADLLTRHVKAAPHPENFFYWAVAQKRAGRAEEAKAAFARFEAAARAEMDTHDNANRELIYFYADHAGKPEEALRLARQEMAWRHDAFTQEAFAWALHRNGDHAEARKQIEAAMEVGVRDAQMLYHAGAIAAALGDRAAAADYFKQSLDTSAVSEVAADARAAAGALGAPPPAPAPSTRG